MQDKLDAAKTAHNKLLADIQAEQAKRVAAYPEATGEIANKLELIRDQYIATKETYDEEENRFFRSKERLLAAKKDMDFFKHMLSTLSQAQAFIDKITSDEVTLFSQVTEQNIVIKDKFASLLPGFTDVQWTAALKDIAGPQLLFQQLHDQIIENTKRMNLCLRLAREYENDRALLFPGHWLETANIVFEQQDFYGFKGSIDYHDLDITKTPGSGLEMGVYSLVKGIALHDFESVRYTLLNSPIIIEQDHKGVIVDRTSYDPSPKTKPVSEKDKNLAAIKCATLLLLDYKAGHKLYINGPEKYLAQTCKIMAALEILAVKAGIDVTDQVEVNVPGWINWLGTSADSLAHMAVLKPQLQGLITAAKADTVFKDTYAEVVKGDVVSGQTIHIQRKSS